MRINSAFGVDFPLRKIFERPAFAAIAGVIDQLAPRRGAAEPGSCAPIPPMHTSHSRSPTCSKLTSRAGTRGSTSAISRCTPTLNLSFRTFFDLERANAALRALVARHPMLRSVVRGDGLQQVLEQVPDCSIALVDLKYQPLGKIEAAFAAERERMSHLVFDLAKWPWFEMRVFPAPIENSVRLFISYDAVMIDAWSAHLIVREFSAMMSGEPSSPPLDVTFRDYVLAENAARESDAWRRAKDYWAARLRPTAAGLRLQLPLAKIAGCHPSVRVSLCAAARGLGPGFVDALPKRFCRRERRHAGCGIDHRVFRNPRRAGSQGAAVSRLASRFSTALRCIRGSTKWWAILPRSRCSTPTFRNPASFAGHARAIQQQLWNDLDHRAYNGVQVARDLARLRGGGRSAPIVTTNIMLDDGFQSVMPGRLAFALTQTPQVLLDQMAAVTGAGGLSVWWDAVEEMFPAYMSWGNRFGVFQDLLGAPRRRGSRVERAGPGRAFVAGFRGN